MIQALEQAVGGPVSRETLDRLTAYSELLKAGNDVQNLVSAATLSSLWERHIVDSAQLVRYAPAPDSSWVDVGSGAGLPGMIIACLVAGPVTLVEPRKLRGEFLRETAAALDLEVTVEQSKVERLTGKFQVITGRAVAALPNFLSMCDHLSTKKTVWVLPKGRSAQSELAEAKRTWQGRFRVEPSVTDEDSRIIVATEVRARKR